MLRDPNLAKCGFKLEPHEEAVMSESGIFLVSIPRLSMQTGPAGGSVKPVHRHKKKHRTQLTCLGSKTDKTRVHFRFCYTEEDWLWDQ